MQSIVEADTGAVGTKYYHLSNTALLVAAPLALLVSPSPLTFPIDLFLGVAFPLHAHIGFNYIISDYVPKASRSLARYALLGVTVRGVWGLFVWGCWWVGGWVDETCPRPPGRWPAMPGWASTVRFVSCGWLGETTPSLSLCMDEPPLMTHPIPHLSFPPNPSIHPPAHPPNQIVHRHVRWA